MPVKSQKIARSFKFRMKEDERLYYPCSENKSADQFSGYPKAAVLDFVFAYADCWFSYAAAQLFELSTCMLYCF